MWGDLPREAVGLAHVPGLGVLTNDTGGLQASVRGSGRPQEPRLPPEGGEREQSLARLLQTNACMNTVLSRGPRGRASRALGRRVTPAP